LKDLCSETEKEFLETKSSLDTLHQQHLEQEKDLVFYRSRVDELEKQEKQLVHDRGTDISELQRQHANEIATIKGQHQEVCA
jgi:hypothetical protein